MTKHETKTVFYASERALRRGTAKMQRLGWEVVRVRSVSQGYSVRKMCYRGLVFLALALLGEKREKRKKRNVHKVTYRRRR